VGSRLAGGQGTLGTAKPVKTKRSNWPYATTVWDYINRAMPFDQPGLLKVKMANRDGFVADPRPDVGNQAERSDAAGSFYQRHVAQNADPYGAPAKQSASGSGGRAQRFPFGLEDEPAPYEP
jgi:hypothetical protein